MQNKFMYSDTSVRIITLNPAMAKDKLDPGVYSVQFNPMTGFYLDILQDALETPPTVYGSVPDKVVKCLTAYKDRPSSTGILLTGDKGTGKTLLMALLADKVMNELQLPIILIRTAFAGDQFESFIQQIGECCLLFDEFGKMYSKSGSGEDTNNQTALLSLLDGIDKTKRLIVLTENSELSINNYLLNRPSRIFYHFKYSKLDDASIIGYCDHNKTPEAVKNGILDICHRSFSFSFDNLQSIVEECKRFDILPTEAVKDLNIDVSTRPIYMEITSIEYKDPKHSQDDEKEVDFQPETKLVIKPDNDNDDSTIIYFSNKKDKGTSILDSLSEEVLKSIPEDMIRHFKQNARVNNQRNMYLNENELKFEDMHTLIYECDDYIVKANKTLKSPAVRYSQYY